MKKNQKKSNNKGFSLVELIVVIAIMAVLMGVLAPTLIGNIEKSRESTDLQNLDSIRNSVVTAMADEAVNKEVMDKVKNAAAKAVAIDMGSAKSAAVSNIDANAYKNLVAELTVIINSSVTMKSAASTGTSGNAKVFIVITENGAVTAVIAESESDALDYEAVECTKTKDESGNMKALLSGAGAAASK